MAFLLGRQSAAANADFNASGQEVAWKFTAAASGLLELIWFNTQQANAGLTTFKVAVYSDTGGADPINLLGEGLATNFTGAGPFFGKLTAPVPIVQGTVYWLAVLPIGEQFDWKGDTSGSYREKAASGGTTFTNPWGAGSAAGTFNAIIWGESINGGAARNPLLEMLLRSNGRRAIALQLINAARALPAAVAGTPYTVAQDDALGITDAIDVSVGRFITQADALGVTDTIVFDRALVVADALGATDSAIPVGAYQRQIDDALGITDLAALGFGLAFADALAITDSAALVEGYARTVADALGITDAQALDRGLLVADALGITDSAAPIILKVAQIDDALGITDATALAVGLSLADALAVTDQLTSTAVLQRTIADALGITDSVAALIIILKQLDDALGLTDALASQAAYVRAVDDALALTDAITLAGVYQRTVADALGITDSTATLRGLLRTVDDPLGVTDAQALVAAYVRSIDDLLVITDLAVTSGVIIQRGHIALFDRVARILVHGSRSPGSVTRGERSAPDPVTGERAANSISPDDRDGIRIEVNDG